MKMKLWEGRSKNGQGWGKQLFPVSMRELFVILSRLSVFEINQELFRLYRNRKMKISIKVLDCFFKCVQYNWRKQLCKVCLKQNCVNYCTVCIVKQWIGERCYDEACKTLNINKMSLGISLYVMFDKYYF